VTDKFLVQPKVEIDAPVIITESTTATGAIRELADTTSSTAIDSVSGTIAFKDVDLNDAHTVGQSAPTFEWSGGTLSEDQKAALTEANTLTLTETDSSGTGFGSVAWTHSAADGAFDFLAKGETLTVQYNVTVDDGHGGPAASQAVTITITGANDAPAVSAAITSTASEDAAPYSVNLLTGASDPDSSDVLHVDANSVSGLAAGVTLNGDSLSVDPNAYDHLAVGEHATVTVKYNVVDGNGGAVAQSATITITGANDAPAVSAAIPMRQTTASWRTLRTAPPSASRRTQPIPTKETPSPISSPAIRTIYSRLMPIPAS
jgi:VCBS repeat-containing protein